MDGAWVSDDLSIGMSVLIVAGVVLMTMAYYEILVLSSGFRNYWEGTNVPERGRLARRGSWPRDRAIEAEAVRASCSALPSRSSRPRT